MDERFTRLSTLPDNIYAKGAPVLISAGALLKDNQTNNVLVQLKITNLSHSVINACKVSVKAYDPSGEELQGVENYSYLDINVSRGKQFGTKKPIDLPDSTTRKIKPIITNVVFADGTVWKNSSVEWVPLPAQKKLAVMLPDQELQQQYEKDVGGDCKYAPMIVDDLFFCACGTINLRKASQCSKCGRDFDVLINALDPSTLIKHREVRHEQEEKEKIRSEQIAAEERVKKAGKKKKAIKLISICTAIIFAVLLAAKLSLPMLKYSNADTLFQSGKYDEAIIAFSELGNYKDCAEKIEICKNEQTYARATEAAKGGNYELAVELYKSLDGYKDSAVKLESVKASLDNQRIEEFLQSDIYKAVLNAVSNVGFEASADFDKDSNTLNVLWLAPNGTYEGMLDVDPSELPLWEEICNILAKTTGEAKQKLDAAGYPYSVTISMLSDTDSTPMIKCIDGEIDYNCVDMEAAHSKAMEKIYNAVVGYIDAGEFDSAKTYWEQNNNNGYYTANYKDLSAYLDYANIMLTTNSRLPGDVILNVEALEKLPSTFTAKDDLLNTLKPLAMLYKAAEGTYEGIPDRQVGLHRYVVSGNEIRSNVQSVINGEWAVRTDVHYADIIDVQISGNTITYSIKNSKGFRQALVATVTDGICNAIKLKDDPMLASDITGTYTRTN